MAARPEAPTARATSPTRSQRAMDAGLAEARPRTPTRENGPINVAPPRRRAHLMGMLRALVIPVVADGGSPDAREGGSYTTPRRRGGDILTNGPIDSIGYGMREA